MRDRMHPLIVAAVLVITAAIPFASPAADSFRLRQLYSNQDGNLQFVELEEVPGSSGDTMFYQFAGLTLSVTNRYGVTKKFTFPNDLPSGLPTGPRHLTIVSQQLPQAGSYSPAFVPDFVMPNQFLPTDGGTVDFAGVDRWTFDSLPILGSGLMRSGDSVTVTQGLPLMQNFVGRQVYPPGGFTTVYEYYYSDTNHYFISGSQPDIDALDTGRIPGWQRTGELFYAGSTDPTPRDGNVCRYYIPPGAHFFSASVNECEAVAQLFPDSVLETFGAFAAGLPDPITGMCPASVFSDLQGNPIELWPVFRLSIDADHRYTTKWDIRQQMIQQGWVPEGYGPYGVVMCVLSTLDF